MTDREDREDLTDIETRARYERDGVRGLVRRIERIEDLTPDERNANKGTERGTGMLERSLRKYGAGRSVLVDAAGRVIAGNKTVERAVDLGLPVRVVETDGHELVVVQRRDLDLLRDKAAKELAIADNRTAEVGLEWDPSALKSLSMEGVDLAEFFLPDELTALLLKGERPPPQRIELREVTSLVDARASEYLWVRHAVLDFSGGRDSTLALLWARKNLPEARIRALYVDLGADYPGYWLHVAAVAEAVGVELTTLRTPKSIIEGLKTRGWPGWKGPWCQEWLHDALAEWVRHNCAVEDTLRLTGMRRKQKKQVTQAKAAGQASDALASTPEYRALAPIYDWGDISARRLLEESRVPIWDGYARGMQRTACWCCPGQRPIAYAALRREYPCLFRAYERLEAVVGVGGFWTPALAGRTVAQAADRGAKMAASKGIAEQDDRHAERGEQAAGAPPFGIAGGGAGEEDDGTGPM